MEQSGGQIDGGEDRLSALHDDLLVLILERLDTTADAARTSVLARRWRNLWRLLTTFRFHPLPDGFPIRELLDAAPDAPGDPRGLRCISVTTQGTGGDFEATWLPAAARRLVGGLAYRSMARDSARNGEEAARMRGCVELPCFENATTIELDLGFCGLALPPVGNFNRLTNLSLRSVEFLGTCDELNNVVSRTRCPFLQKLSICYIGGLSNLSIDSVSLLQLELKGCDLFEMTIVTPYLKKLSVRDSFPYIAEGDDDPSEPVANITAPQTVSLVWMELYDPRYFNLGNLGQLRELQTRHFVVYGEQSHRVHNHHCLMLLQRFQVLQSLHLTLFYHEDISDCLYLLEDITVLPHITFLQLELCNHGHAFGASLFHLLRMCIGLRRLLLVLPMDNSSSLEEELACPSDCICDEPENWKTDELVLGDLEDVRITGLQGVGHEVAFVQRLLGWATVLKSLRITLDNKMTEGKAMEFREALAGFSRPETCVQFDRIGD